MKDLLKLIFNPLTYIAFIWLVVSYSLREIKEIIKEVREFEF